MNSKQLNPDQTQNWELIYIILHIIINVTYMETSRDAAQFFFFFEGDEAQNLNCILF